MKKFRYSLSTNTIWTSFDFGEVEAENVDGALVKAEAELRYNIGLANAALIAKPETRNWSIEMNYDNIEIEEIKE